MQTFNDILLNTESSTEPSESEFLCQFVPKTQNNIIQTRLDIVLKVDFLLNHKTYPLEEFIDHGIISFLVDCLKVPNNNLQSHSALTLSKFTDRGITENCQAVIDCGGLKVLIELLIPSDGSFKWYIYPLLGDLLKWKPLTSDECFEFGLYDILTSIISPKTTLYEWCRISGILCFIELNPKLSKLIELFLSSMHKYLPNSAGTINETTLNEISIILYNFCSQKKQLCQMVVNSGILQKIIYVLCFSKKAFMLQILNVLNCVLEYQEFNYKIIEYEYLHIIEELLELNGTDVEIVEISCDFIFSLGKNPDSIQAIIDSNLIYTLIDMSEWGLFKEKTADTLQYLLYSANEEQTTEIIRMNAIPVLSTFLNAGTEDEDLIQEIVETFFKVLEKCENSIKAICDEMKEYGIDEKIMLLQNHENEGILEAATKLLNSYFQKTEDLEK